MVEGPAPADVPAGDAPLDVWLEYAEALGLEIDRGRTNRSRIRTLLRIPQQVKQVDSPEPDES